MYSVQHLFHSRGSRVVLTRSQLSQWYMRLVRDCTLWRAAQSLLISMQQAQRRRWEAAMPKGRLEGRSNVILNQRERENWSNRPDLSIFLSSFLSPTEVSLFILKTVCLFVPYFFALGHKCFFYCLLYKCWFQVNKIPPTIFFSTFIDLVYSFSPEWRKLNRRRLNTYPEVWK